MFLIMAVGVLIFAAGVIVGTRLDRIARDVRSEPDPLEGENGFLSYKNLDIRKRYPNDDDEEDDDGR